MKGLFVKAFMACYGASKSKALATYNNAKSCGDNDYIEAVIDMWEQDCKRGFYED